MISDKDYLWMVEEMKAATKVRIDVPQTTDILNPPTNKEWWDGVLTGYRAGFGKHPTFALMSPVTYAAVRLMGYTEDGSVPYFKEGSTKDICVDAVFGYLNGNVKVRVTTRMGDANENQVWLG